MAYCYKGGLLFFGGSDISFAVWVIRYFSILITSVSSRLLRWNIVVLRILIITHSNIVSFNNLYLQYIMLILQSKS